MITNAQLTHTPGPSTCRFPHIGVPSLFVLLYTLPEGWISSQICTFSSFCCRRPVIFVSLLTLIRRQVPAGRSRTLSDYQLTRDFGLDLLQLLLEGVDSTRHNHGGLG